MSDTLENSLTIDLIPDGIYRLIAQEIGVNNFLKLADILGGGSFYIPTRDKFTRVIRDEKIRQEFNGYNISELAKRYSITERWVRQILDMKQ